MVADKPLVQARRLMAPQLGLLYVSANCLVLLDLAYMSAVDTQARRYTSTLVSHTATAWCQWHSHPPLHRPKRGYPFRIFGVRSCDLWASKTAAPFSPF